MKQKNTAIGKAFLCGGAAMLLLAGCVKESAINEKYRPAGTPITFSAATGYENGTGTRTEYSGQLYGNTPKYERIDWLSGDPVTITYVHGTPATSQYQVTEVSGTTDKNSYASVEVASGQTKLTWGEGEGDHTFYAMYPSTGFQGNGTASLTSSNHVQGSVPATQTLHLSADGTKYLPPMQYGYMVAYKNISGTSTESRVTLPFTPAVTAFEFKLQRAQDDPGVQKVTGVELTATTPLTGTFAFDISGGNDNGATWDTTIGTGATTVTNIGNTVSFTFPVEGGVSLPAYGSENYLDFTVFALPVEQTGLTLKLIFESGNFKTMALNDSGESPQPHRFEAAKKHVITNKTVPGGFEYVIQPTGATVTLEDGTIAGLLIRYDWMAGDAESSFESYVTNDGGVTKTPVSVEAYEYGYEEVDGTVTWYSTIPVEYLTALTFSGNGYQKTIKAALTENVDVDHYTGLFLEHAQSLKNRPAVSDLDLSLYEAGKLVTPRTGDKRVTANSYIIDRPGTFKFPLVYGNAIDWTRTTVVDGVNPQETGWNVYSYSDGSHTTLDEHPNYWSDFCRFDGKKITSPYILSDLGLSSDDVEAVVVWEDVESADYSMLTVQEMISDESVSGFCNSDGSALGTVPYIKFTIPVGIITGDELDYPFDRVTGIREGNILIALRTNKTVTIDGVSFPAHTLLWDWHIWISDQDMTPVPVMMRSPYNTITDHHDFLPVPMGFCQDFVGIYHKPRIMYVRIRQSDPESNASAVFQIVHARSLEDRQTTTGVTYQWGRHTPLLPTYFYDPPKESDLGSSTFQPTIGTTQYGLIKEAYSPADYPLYNTQGGSKRSLHGTGYWNLPRVAINHIQDTFNNPTKWATNNANEWFPLSEYPGPFANLWNMDCHSLTDRMEIKVSKTVYDPCPPGFCLPDCLFFSFIAKSGTITEKVVGANLNAVDINNDGKYDTDDFEDDFYREDHYRWGTTFYTGYGANTYYLTQPAAYSNGVTLRSSGSYFQPERRESRFRRGGTITGSGNSLNYYQTALYQPSESGHALPVKELN